MKYCTKCKVNVHHQLNNCPLCGGYLNKANDNDNCKMYLDMDEVVTYPVLHEKTRSPFMKSKLSWLLIVALLLCVAINVITTPSNYWSVYVFIGVTFTILCVIMPITDKWSIIKLGKISVLTLTVLSIIMELTVLHGKFNWFCVEYILPWIYVAYVVLLDFLIIFSRKKNRRLFTSLFFATVVAICPQIAFWIASLFGITTNTHIAITVTISSIANLVIFGILFSKSLRDEMERNFNV